MLLKFSDRDRPGEHTNFYDDGCHSGTDPAPGPVGASAGAQCGRMALLLMLPVFLGFLLLYPFDPAGADIYLQKTKGETYILTSSSSSPGILLIRRERRENGALFPDPDVLKDLVEKTAKEVGIPEALILAVIHGESAGDSRARSSAGAAGLMQLMPSTARAMGVEDVWDPEENVLGGARYLKQLLDRYRGNLKLTLAAYNAGPGTVSRYGGVPPYHETRRFLHRTLDVYEIFKGISDIIYTFQGEDGMLHITNIH